MPFRHWYADAPDYCHYYFDLVKSDELLDELQQSKELLADLISTIPASSENYSYAPGKWTIKEVIRHITDCERVYAYRAFRFSRLDETELPGFDENAFIAAAGTAALPMDYLLTEFLSVRESTIQLFAPLTAAQLDFKGRANGHTFTARTFGFMAAGHLLHHAEIIKTNYLKVE